MRLFTRPVFLWLAGAGIVLMLGAGHLATRRLNLGPLHSMIEKRLSDAAGLDVKVGTLRAALLPAPHFDAEGVRIANLPGRPSSELLRIEHVDLGLALWPLFRRTVEIDTLSITGAELHIEPDDEGRWAADLPFGAKKNPDDDPIRFDLRRLRIEKLLVVYRDARKATPHKLVVESVAIDSKHWRSEISLEARGQLDGSDIVLSGQIGSFFELLTPGQPYPVDLEGQIFEAEFEARGSVRSPRSLEGLDLEVSAEIPELVVAGQSFPHLGAIRFDGQLSNIDGSLGLETFHLSGAKDGPTQIDAHGKFDDLLQIAEIEIDARFNAGTIDSLRPLLEKRIGFALPPIASFSGQAKFSDKTGKLIADGFARAASPDDAIVLQAKGGSSDLKRAAEIDFELEMLASDVTQISKLFPQIPEHGPLGPVTARGRLKSHHHTLSADGIDVVLGDRKKAWAEIAGTIQDVIELRGVDLEVDFGAASLHHLKETLARELPETSAFVGKAGVHEKDGALQLKHARLHGGEDSPVEIHLDARFDEVPGRDRIEIDLGIRGHSLSELGALAGLDLPGAVPVDFRGKVEGLRNQLEVQDLALQLGETHLSGNLSGSFAADTRPAIKGRLESPEIRLQDLGLTRSEKRSSDAPATDSSPFDDLHAKLPFEKLRHLDLDLGLQFARVGGYEGLEGSDVRLDIQLNDGLLEIPAASATYEGGQLSVRLRADAHRPDPTLAIGIETNGLHIARVVSQFEKNTDYSGQLDAAIDLKADGDTVHELLQSLTGKVGLAVRDGNAASKIAREFVVNLAAVVFRDLGRKEPKHVGCGVAHVEIENGIAHVRSLVLSEKDIRVSGSGDIDLVRGQYDLKMIPRNSNPGIVSMAPEVKVTGPLDAPVFHTVKHTLVTSFGRGLFHNTVGAPAAVLKPFLSRRNPMKGQAERCRLATADPQ